MAATDDPVGYTGVLKKVESIFVVVNRDVCVPFKYCSVI